MSLTAGEIIWKINGDSSGFDRSIQKSEKSAKSFGGLLTKASIAVVAFGAATFAMAKHALGGAAALEQNEIALTTMLKSASKAKTILEEFRKFGASTPFETSEIIKSGKQLIAFGVSADNVMDSLKQIGDVAAGIGAPLGELSEIYGKIKVSSTVFNEDLNQLAGRGIPIFEELAKVMNVNASEIKKLSSEGKIGFEEIEKAFVNMSSSGGKFAGLMEAQSKSLGGLYSTLKSQLSEMSVEVGQRLAPAFKELLTTLVNSKIVLPAIKAIFMGIASVINGFVRAVNWAISGLEELVKKFNAVDRAADIKNLEESIKSLKVWAAQAGKSSVNGKAYTAMLEKQKFQLVKLRIEQQKYLLSQAKDRNEAITKKLDASTKSYTQNSLAIAGNNRASAKLFNGAQSQLYGSNEKLTKSMNTSKAAMLANGLELEKNNKIQNIAKAKIAALEAEWRKLNKQAGNKGPIATFNEGTKGIVKNVDKAKTAFQQLQEVMSKIGSGVASSMGQVQEIFSNIEMLLTAQADARLTALDVQMEKELEAAGLSDEITVASLQKELAAAEATGDAETALEKEQAIEKLKIEKKFAAEKAKIEYELAVMRWQFQLMTAIATLPLTILNGITAGFQIGPWGGAIFGALAAVAGGIQIAAIAASRPTPASFQTGGIVSGNQIAGDNVAAQVNSGEMILNGAQQRQLFNVANGTQSDGGSNGMKRVRASEKATWAEIYQASKNGYLYIDERAVVDK